MRTRVSQLWEALRASFWFLPSLMAAAAVALSFASIELDERVGDEWLGSLGWMYVNRPEGARALLSTVAGSMVTVAGVVFSITIVALTLASSQFGPRLLRNFMRDRGNQAVLGLFIATFLYCLLVLRTIHGEDDSAFVPHLAVTAGVVLAVGSMGVLIYFIHHVASSIQAENVIAVVARDLDGAIERQFPRDAAADEGVPPQELPPDAAAVRARDSDYLQAVDTEGLVEFAAERDLVLHLRLRPGAFVTPGAVLASAGPVDRLDGEAADRIRAGFLLGTQRTITEDPEFAILQLVEVAVRALSPGVNDPFTAVACVDRLGAALCRLAARGAPSRHLLDEDGRLRLVVEIPTFSGLTDAAFHQIRQYARTSAAVTIRLLEALADVARETRTEEQREALRRHADMLIRGARDALPEELDRDDAEARHQALLTALEAARARQGAGEGDGRGAIAQPSCASVDRAPSSGAAGGGRASS
ncbi:MAG: DUF2254 domain-containing protein [Gemmatimonadota bacterium]